MEPSAKSDAVVAEIVPPAKKSGSILPLIAVVLLVPALCYGVMDFLIIPKIKTAVSAALASEKSKVAPAEGKEGEKKEGKEAAAGEHTAEFGPTMVNLSGTSSSRYLRVNFVVASEDANIEEIVKEHQSALRDVAINILSTQTLAGLDAEGSRNAVKNQLIDQFNRSLGSQVISQIYFSEFVVQ